MDRLESSDGTDLALTTINLTGDVLINAVRLFEKSAQTRDISLFKITNLQKAGFFKLPKVKANVRALMTVFRNLVENALKYRNHEENKCIVKISHSFDHDYVYIYFTDYGIGIPEGDEFDVFDEGFRSDNAVRQDPAGTGLGLTQSKEIMISMGGDLVLKSLIPVTLVVKIKKAEV
jgi:signal transduction histidine kinase